VVREGWRRERERDSVRGEGWREEGEREGDRQIVTMWCVLLSVCFNVPLQLLIFLLSCFIVFFIAALKCLKETFLIFQGTLASVLTSVLVTRSPSLS
jgi:hypothetical protein